VCRAAVIKNLFSTFSLPQERPGIDAAVFVYVEYLVQCSKRVLVSFEKKKRKSNHKRENTLNKPNERRWRMQRNKASVVSPLSVSIQEKVSLLTPTHSSALVSSFRMPLAVSIARTASDANEGDLFKVVSDNALKKVSFGVLHVCSYVDAFDPLALCVIFNALIKPKCNKS
jgi:hypothetical protein